jgi:hypothetical protein
MQNLSSSTPALQPIPTAPATPAEKLSEAQMLVASAFRRADDESNDYLSWHDRDRMCRQLNNALRLIREAKETITPAPPAADDDDETETIICSECGDEVDEGQALRGECLTCAYYYAQANAF